MFAKLHFDSGWSTSDVLIVLSSVIGGNTNVNSIPGTPAKFIPSLSYVLTTKNVSGWSLEASSGTARVFSAPCKDSTKKKYMRIAIPNNRMSCEVGESVNVAAVQLTGQVSLDDGGTGAITALLFSGSSNSGVAHNVSYPLEVWVSASARHCIVAANQPGYAHGRGGNGGRDGGWVCGVFEHANADSWLTDSSSYIPACVLSTVGHQTANGTVPLTFYRNRTRDITQPTATDFTGIVDGNKMYAYTKYGQDTISQITLGGTCNVQLDENTTVKALLPFGVKNSSALVRGGAISDLCDVYLAPATIFKENLQIQVGTNTANRYHIWNLGFTSNNAATNYNLAVPRG